jgi:hypothetical protein
MKFGIALIGFKGVSDGAKPLTGELVQWTELLPVIDKNLPAAMSELKARLRRGEIKKEELMRMPTHWERGHATFGGLNF